MKKILFLLISTLFILVSCSNETNKSIEKVQTPKDDENVTATDSVIEAKGSSNDESNENENKSVASNSEKSTEPTNENSNNNNEPVKKLSREEVHVLADQLVEQYDSALDSQKKLNFTEMVVKMDIIDDKEQYPEVFLLDQVSGQSEIQVFRYITEHRLYPGTKNQWISVYRNVEHNNSNGTQPLQHFGTMQFTENGKDYPVIGYYARSSFLNFFLLGSDENEQIITVFDSMGEDIPAGKLVIDALIERKIDVMMRGELEYSITAEDIK